MSDYATDWLALRQGGGSWKLTPRGGTANKLPTLVGTRCSVSLAHSR